MKWQRGPDLSEITYSKFSGKVFTLTSLELVKEGLLDLTVLSPLGILPSSLLAHLTVQHSLIKVRIWNCRPATGVLSNIDHKQKNPNIDQISTTQHFIDQISTAKFT